MITFNNELHKKKLNIIYITYFLSPTHLQAQKHVCGSTLSSTTSTVMDQETPALSGSCFHSSSYKEGDMLVLFTESQNDLG